MLRFILGLAKAGLFLFSHPDQMGQRAQVIRTHHYIHMRRSFQQVLFHLLGNAPGNYYLQVSFSFLEGCKLAQVAEHPVVGISPDATGVINYDISLAYLQSLLEMTFREKSCYALRVMLVHLAPEGADVKFLTHSSDSAKAPIASCAPAAIRPPVDQVSVPNLDFHYLESPGRENRIHQF